MIELKTLSVGYRGQAVLSNVNLSCLPGRILTLIGPNGCGKSTLVKTVLGLLPQISGEILIDNVPLEQMTPRQIAQKAAYLAQSRNVPNITAGRLVLHGRFPYLSYPRRYRDEDRLLARQALRTMQAEPLSEQFVNALSGGQRQKIYLAMALAQDTQTIFMDEPTTYLDVHHQQELVQVARHMAAQGKAVVMVLHDLCLALRTADQIGILADGALQQLGTPEEIFSGGILEHIFHVSLGRIQTNCGWRYYYE